MNIARWLTDNAERCPDKAALRCTEGTLCYAAVAQEMERVAAALHGAGLKPGDRVAWLGLNSAASLCTLFACARQGLVFMPLNWRLAPPEHRAMLCDCPPALLVADEPFAASSAEHGVAPASTRLAARGRAPQGWDDWVDLVGRAPAPPPPAAPVADATPVLLCWTSGSTGRPKGVVLSHGALAANADASVDMHAMTAVDHVLTTLPLFHVGGLNIQTTPALRSGCTVTLHARFDVQATFDAIERDGITLTVLVPAQLEAMLAHPRWASVDLRGLRMISTGSTQVPERLIRAVHARGVPLVQVWGATETAPIAACLHAPEAQSKAGTVGRAAAGCSLRIVDAQGQDVPPGTPGEVLVRGRNLMNGYWADEAATARALEGGWLHSGDMGHLDAEGYLSIDGRIKDMIICGGENVSPAEVEAVLLEHPQIAEAAVVGRPDARWGEAVVAVVVAQPGAQLTREMVTAPFVGRLARFKHPDDVLFVDALPRSALGKVRKEELRRLVSSLPTPEAAAPTAPTQERIS